MYVCQRVIEKKEGGEKEPNRIDYWNKQNRNARGHDNGNNNIDRGIGGKEERGPFLFPFVLFFYYRAHYGEETSSENEKDKTSQEQEQEQPNQN